MLPRSEHGCRRHSASTRDQERSCEPGLAKACASEVLESEVNWDASLQQEKSAKVFWKKMYFKERSKRKEAEKQVKKWSEMFRELETDSGDVQEEIRKLLLQIHEKDKKILKLYGKGRARKGQLSNLVQHVRHDHKLFLCESGISSFQLPDEQDMVVSEDELLAEEVGSDLVESALLQEAN